MDPITKNRLCITAKAYAQQYEKLFYEYSGIDYYEAHKSDIMNPLYLSFLCHCLKLMDPNTKQNTITWFSDTFNKFYGYRISDTVLVDIFGVGRIQSIQIMQNEKHKKTSESSETSETSEDISDKLPPGAIGCCGLFMGDDGW